MCIAAKGSEGSSAASLIQLFCRVAREFFQVAGVYYWRRQPNHDFVGEQAEGKLAEHFVGLRLGPHESAVTAEAARQRRTIFLNQVQTAKFPLAQDFGASSLMAAPLVVFNQVVGAVTFLHDRSDNFFNEDSAAKATILAGQLGSLLEAVRLRETSLEQHRKTEIIAGVAQVLDGTPDVSAVIEALAERVRLLLRTPLVCVLVRREGPFELRAVSAETPQLANSVRARHDRQMIRFASDLAQRAVSAGEPITLSLGTDAHSLGSLVSPGMLIAAPFHTSRTQGAILAYPRQEGPFSPEEKALVAAIAGFGAVAVAHAELYSTAHAQAHELHQLLEISSELSSSGDLERFLQAFVVRAADFLGFGRCFIALQEETECHVRYVVDKGVPQKADQIFPDGVALRTLRNREVFATDDVSKVPGVNLDMVAKHRVQQFLAVPLLDASGSLLGMFGLLDHFEGKSISGEDIRRARALSNHAAVALEAARNLHLSEQHRGRAEATIELAREIDSLRSLPDFSTRFVQRACEVAGFQAGALALFEDGDLQIAAVYPHHSEETSFSSTAREVKSDRENYSLDQPFDDLNSKRGATSPANPLRDQFAVMLEAALTDFSIRHSEVLVSGSAAELLGPAADQLGWEDCTIIRFPGSGSDLAGLLCLSGRSHGLNKYSLNKEDRMFLESMTAHAGAALDNVRLLSQLQQANLQWLEIFDAITDFVVVHDETDKVIRVNRSLATMIGVPARELIGVNIRALLAVSSDVSSYSCPFCRPMSEDTDEFIHPVMDRTYLVSTSRLRGTSGEGIQTIHVLKDISDRREAERRYRELFDNIQEGLFFSTPEGRFIEVNEAMVRMLGYSSRQELLQIDIPTQLYFSPEQRQQHADAMRESGHMRNFEATLRRKNGAPIHVLINAFGLYSDSGQLIQIRGLMLDVTGLHTYQSELHRERDFSGKILSNTQNLILVADTAGLISYANRRWSDSGFQQRDLLGRPLLELAAPGFVRVFAEAVQNTLNGNQVDNLELQVSRGNGIAGQFSANLSPMRDEHENVTSIIVVLTDITDSTLLRDKLIHAEKMAAVGQLVSGVAHEVNNPLTAILGFADLLMENPDLPDNARKDLRVILQEAQRTKQIVQNLLSVARQMPPQRNALQLNLILRRTIQLRSYDFNSHGVEVVEHLDEVLPEVVGDAQQLQQVFLNILNNAYDAVHEIGRPARIEIMTAKTGGTVEVSFRDNGQGITHSDRIFDPFFTTKEIGKGTGLGLSICYGIVKEHGGEILCHNNSDGQGATFVVRLPVAVHAASFGVAAGEIPT
ncbi:MAG TPA: PAS domain-containing protein [Candidatus Sulfotelmatobacter sp.]